MEELIDNILGMFGINQHVVNRFDLERSINSHIEQYNDEIADLRYDTDRLEGENYDLEERLQGFNETVEDLEAEKASLEEEIETLRSQIEELETVNND